jgi:hypothetical protein
MENSLEFEAAAPTLADEVMLLQSPTVFMRVPQTVKPNDSFAGIPNSTRSLSKSWTIYRVIQLNLVSACIRFPADSAVRRP